MLVFRQPFPVVFPEVFWVIIASRLLPSFNHCMWPLSSPRCYYCPCYVEGQPEVCRETVVNNYVRSHNFPSLFLCTHLGTSCGVTSPSSQLAELCVPCKRQRSLSSTEHHSLDLLLAKTCCGALSHPSCSQLASAPSKQKMPVLRGWDLDGLDACHLFSPALCTTNGIF